MLRASSSRFAENLLCLCLPCQVQLANLQVEFVLNSIFLFFFLYKIGEIFLVKRGSWRLRLFPKPKNSRKFFQKLGNFVTNFRKNCPKLLKFTYFLDNALKLTPLQKFEQKYDFSPLKTEKPVSRIRINR